MEKTRRNGIHGTYGQSQKIGILNLLGRLFFLLFYILWGASCNVKAQFQPRFDDGDLSEARKIYEETVKRVGSDGYINVAFILNKVSVNDSNTQKKEAKSRIDSIYIALQAGLDFETYAKRLSQDQNFANGVTGWVARYMLDKEVGNVAFTMQPGELSKPILLSSGWIIIKVIERKQMESFDYHKENILNFIAQNKQTKYKFNLISQAKNKSIAKSSVPIENYKYHTRDSIEYQNEKIVWYIVEQSDGTQGVLFDDNTIWIPIERKYTFIRLEEEGYWNVHSNIFDEGICNLLGQEIIPPKYKSLEYTGNTFVYEGIDGNPVPLNISISDLYNAEVCKMQMPDPIYRKVAKDGFVWYDFYYNGKHGIKDKKGKILLPPNYCSVEYKDGYLWGSIPKDSWWVSECYSISGDCLIHHNSGFFMGNFCPLKENKGFFLLIKIGDDKQYICDATGKGIFQIEENETFNYSKQWGFVLKNKEGEWEPLGYKLDKHGSARFVSTSSFYKKKRSHNSNHSNNNDMFSNFWDGYMSDLQFQRNMFNGFWDNVNPVGLQQNTPVSGRIGDSSSSSTSSMSTRTPTTSQHDACNGTGKCRTCNGTGEMWAGLTKKKCVNCHGTGSCAGCNGTGRSSAHYY